MRRGKRKKNRKASGHSCWSCDRRLPNENFSGGGHRRHLCRECETLGTEELEYRQAVNDIDRGLTECGCVRKKRRHAFERYLFHSNPRVRAYAQEIQENDRREREAMRREEEGSLHEEDFSFPPEASETVDPRSDADEDIPF